MSRGRFVTSHRVGTSTRLNTDARGASVLRRLSVGAAATVFIAAGLGHLLWPETYERIVPPALPFPRLLVLLSGLAEITGGFGLLIPASRRPAGWGLIVLLAAVFPANIYMALRPEKFPQIPPAALWLRLPLQGVLMAWVWRVGSTSRHQAFKSVSR